MSYNSEESSQPSSPTSSSAGLIGFAGLTHQQAIDHQYPIAPLEPGYIDGGPYYLGRGTGPSGSARLVSPPPPQYPPRRRSYHSRSPSPLSGLANRDRIFDQVAPGNQLPIRVRARAPAPSGVQLPALGAVPDGSGLVATPDAARAALMARLTNEAMNSPPGCGTRQQLAEFRAMPIRRQLSLREGYNDFGRNLPSYWDAAAGYVVGDVATQPCSGCARGRGMFTECVVVRRPGGGPQPMAGACTGCYYQHKGSSCHLA